MGYSVFIECKRVFWHFVYMHTRCSRSVPVVAEIRALHPLTWNAMIRDRSAILHEQIIATILNDFPLSLV